MNPPQPLREPEFGPVSTVMTVLGIGKTQAYALLATGTVASIRVGKRGVRVDLRDLDRYVAELRQSAGAA